MRQPWFTWTKKAAGWLSGRPPALLPIRARKFVAENRINGLDDRMVIDASDRNLSLLNMPGLVELTSR